MAIYHLSARAISRGEGRSAVAAAAYRRGARMENRQEELVSDYSRKERVAHSEMSLPEDAPEWLQALAAEPGSRGSEELWNIYEEFETRKNALLARETIIALPTELTLEQNVALVREFVESEFAGHGVVTDWSIHNEQDNPHAHVMILPRHAVEEGFGPKSEPIVNADGEVVLRKNGQPMYKPVVGSRDDLSRWREAWAGIQNEHLARHGHDVRVDHRSYKEQGIDLVPTRHIGPAGKGLWERTRASDRYSEFQKVLAENGRRILENPEEIIRKVAYGRSVFTENDLVREAGVYLNTAEEVEVFRQRVMASDQLVKLADEVRHETKDWVLSAARYTSQEMLAIETEMAGLASKMASGESHGISINQGKAALREFSFLGPEQQVAVEHVLINKQLASVVGFAGSGKTTMVEAAKHAWEAAGYTVKGGALSGIAAQGLGEGAGIESRTLASWEYAWARDRDQLTNKDILVVDEAGMVGSRQMRDVLSRVHEAGAKVVLIGDAEQLQPIEAGAAFRAITEQSGAAVIGEIRRQNEEWMRDASKAFATHDTAYGFAAYQERGHVVHEPSAEEAKSKLVADWMEARGQGGDQIILAHRRVDVADLNLSVRERLVEAGELVGGKGIEVAGGLREMAPREQVIFQSNDRALGVKNGMLGTVEKVGAGHLDVRVPSGEGPGRVVAVNLKEYNSLDYGYAATIHKSQGVTVDRSFVYGSRSMDRHLTYVSMTRHRDDVKFYSSADEFKDPATIGAKLSRGRLQSTTLDYLELRQAVPERDRAAYLKRTFERQTERLRGLTARLAEIPNRLRERFGVEVGAPELPARASQETVSPRAEGSQSEASVLDQSSSERAPFIPAMSKHEISRARAELMEPKAIDQHVNAQQTVINAEKRLLEAAGRVSPEFQTDMSKLVSKGGDPEVIQELASSYRLDDATRESISRKAVNFSEKVQAARAGYETRVDRALARSSIEVPGLSDETQKWADKMAEFRNTEQAAQHLKENPMPQNVSAELKTFEKALRDRFGTRDLDQLNATRPIDLKLSGVGAEKVHAKANSIGRSQSMLDRALQLIQRPSLGRGPLPGQ